MFDMLCTKTSKQTCMAQVRIPTCARILIAPPHMRRPAPPCRRCFPLVALALRPRHAVPHPRNVCFPHQCLQLVTSTHDASVVLCLRHLHPHLLRHHCLMLVVMLALVGLTGKMMMIMCLRLCLLLNLRHAYIKVYDSQNNILMVLFAMVCLPLQVNPALLLKILRTHAGIKQCKMNKMR
jgi:hypothetical protein